MPMQDARNCHRGILLNSHPLKEWQFNAQKRGRDSDYLNSGVEARVSPVALRISLPAVSSFAHGSSARHISRT
jgi:hypothetical protein